MIPNLLFTLRELEVEHGFICILRPSDLRERLGGNQGAGHTLCSLIRRWGHASVRNIIIELERTTRCTEWRVRKDNFYRFRFRRMVVDGYVRLIQPLCKAVSEITSRIHGKRTWRNRHPGKSAAQLRRISNQELLDVSYPLLFLLLFRRTLRGDGPPQNLAHVRDGQPIAIVLVDLT